MIQLLYGNDGVNYKTIAKSTGITDRQEKSLLSSYLVDCSENENGAYIYAVTDLAGDLGQEMILFGRSAKMNRFSTPSYYSHIILEDVKESFRDSEFLSILNRQFIEENELDFFEGKLLDDNLSESKKSFDDNILAIVKIEAILCSILSVVDDMSKKVKIIVNAKREDYNQYVWNLIASIYKYIPYNLRKKAGFITNAKFDYSQSGRIKVLFIPEESGVKEDVVTINLNNDNFKQVINNTDTKIVKFVESIVEKSDKDRIALFEYFETNFGRENVTVEEHMELYFDTKRWSEAPLEEILDEVVKYAWINRRNESKMISIFKHLMGRRFNDVYYNNLLEVELSKQSGDMKDFEKDMIQLLNFGEFVDSIQIDYSIFEKWLKKDLLSRFSRKYQDLDLYNKLDELYQEYRNDFFIGEKMNKIRFDLSIVIDDQINLLRDEIKKKIDEEQDSFKVYFDSKSNFEELLDTIDDKYNSIKYKKTNQRDFKAQFAKYVFNIFIDEENAKDGYIFWSKNVEKTRNYLEEKDYRKFIDLLDDRRRIIAETKENSILIFNGRKDIKLAYEFLYKKAAFSKESGINISDIRIQINGVNKFILDEDEFIKLLDFIIMPNDRTWIDVGSVFEYNESLIEEMLESDFFTTDHFLYLTNHYKMDGFELKNVLKYYVNNDIFLEDKIIDQAISGIDFKRADDLIDVSVDRRTNLTRKIMKAHDYYRKTVEKEKREKSEYLDSKKNQNSNKRRNKKKIFLIISTLLLFLIVIVVLLFLFTDIASYIPFYEI